MELSEPDCKNLLELSVHLLGQRDFTGCRAHALLARELDPNLPQLDQILAIAEVLLAADRRFDNNGRIDWYSILQVQQSDSENKILIRSHFINLLTLLNPLKNKLSFSGDAFQLVRDAWAVLSDPEKKSRYDNEILVKEQKLKRRRREADGHGEGDTENGNESVESFWTVCPYCYYMYEYERVYVDCCLRCQNCKCAFHGVVIDGPPPTSIVEGKEQYYFYLGLFPLKFRGEVGGPVNDEKKEDGMNGEIVVKVSDDQGSSDELHEANARREEGTVEKAEYKNDGKRMRVKTVARKRTKTRKAREGELMGEMEARGVKFNEESVQMGKAAIDGLEFFEGDDDIYVSILDN